MRKFLVAVFCILSVLTVFGADNKDRLLTVIFTNDFIPSPIAAFITA